MGLVVGSPRASYSEDGEHQDVAGTSPARCGTVPQCAREDGPVIKGRDPVVVAAGNGSLSTPTKRQPTRTRLTRFLAGRAAGEDVIVAYVFGSVARGDDRAGSDVDVAVLYRRDPPATFDALPLRLEGDIERLLGRRVEVVSLNTASPDLRARVLRDGLLLIDRDPRARIGFEVRARNEWFDLQPVLRTYRRIAAPVR